MISSILTNFILKTKVSQKNMLIYYNGYEVLAGVKPLYIIFNKIIGYIKDNKCCITLNILLNQKIITRMIMMKHT